MSDVKSWREEIVPGWRRSLRSPVSTRGSMIRLYLSVLRRKAAVRLRIFLFAALCLLYLVSLACFGALMQDAVRQPQRDGFAWILVIALAAPLTAKGLRDCVGEFVRALRDWRREDR